ncbi:hypothetical protein GTU79_08890 [Sodalis ligni]|nr:hypothetical protein GTU79_08890 [Sodalis ligni]
MLRNRPFLGGLYEQLTLTVINQSGAKEAAEKELHAMVESLEILVAALIASLSHKNR